MSLKDLPFLKDLSGKSYLNWFSIWFLLYPFDAYVLPVSIGFMTIYPHLILTFLLLGWSYFHKKKEIPERHLQWAIIYYVVLALFGIISIFFVEGKRDAIYATRSLIMLAATVALLIRSYSIIGQEGFFRRIFQLSFIVFVFFSAAAYFEFFTGIHFESPHTDKLLLLPASNITYAPTFLYQNPNTFLCYLFSSALIMILSSKSLQRNFLPLLPIFLTLLFFSIAADSLLGKLASSCMAVFFAVSTINMEFIKKYSFQLKSFFFLVVCIALIATQNALYLGPIWKNGKDYVLNDVQVIEERKGKLHFLSSADLREKYGKEEIIRSYYNYQNRGKAPSSEVRKNLFLNGVELIKKYPITGVGAGQYSWKSAHHELPNNTGTVISPHESVTEFASQYGLPMLLWMFSIIGMTFLFVVKENRHNIRFILLWCFLLGISWVVAAMPSAWLVLNCGWILMAMILLSPNLHTPQRVER